MGGGRQNTKVSHLLINIMKQLFMVSLAVITWKHTSHHLTVYFIPQEYLISLIFCNLLIASLKLAVTVIAHIKP